MFIAMFMFPLIDHIDPIIAAILFPVTNGIIEYPGMLVLVVGPSVARIVLPSSEIALAVIYWANALIDPLSNFLVYYSTKISFFWTHLSAANKFWLFWNDLSEACLVRCWLDDWVCQIRHKPEATVSIVQCVVIQPRTLIPTTFSALQAFL